MESGDLYSYALAAAGDAAASTACDLLADRLHRHVQPLRCARDAACLGDDAEAVQMVRTQHAPFGARRLDFE